MTTSASPMRLPRVLSSQCDTDSSLKPNPAFFRYAECVIVVLVSLLVTHALNVSIARAMPPSDASYIVTPFGIPEGLPTKTITDVTYGKDGYLYLASVAGLIRMDGHHIDLFSTDTQQGLISNRISRTYSLSERTLLIQDHLGNVFRFKNETTTPVLNPRTSVQLSSNAIRMVDDGYLLLADQENIYLISDDSTHVIGKSLSIHPIWDVLLRRDTVYLLNTDGLYLSKPDGYSKVELPGPFMPDLSFHSRIVEMDSHIIVLGRQKSVCYDAGTASWCPIHSVQLANEKTEILNIRKFKSDVLYSTTDGFYVRTVDSITKAFQSKGGLMYESLFATEFGEILVGSDGVWINGEVVFKPKIKIYDADIDKDGVLWISSFQDGIFSIRRNEFSNHSGEQFLNSYSIVKDFSGNVWIGSFENGLVKWNGRDFTQYNQENGRLPGNTVRMISLLKNDGVMISVWGEPPIMIHEGKIEPLEDFRPLFGNRTNVTESFHEDKTGRLWFGTLNGLFVKEGNKYSTFYDNNRTTITNISKIVASPFNDDLFFCTTNKGLILLRDNRFHFLSAELPPSTMHVRDIHVASADTIWALAYNDGIQRFTFDRRSNSFAIDRIGNDVGLQGTGYHRIIPDTTGMFWISTNNGLLRVSERGLNRSIENGVLSTDLHWYREEDGIMDREFNGGSQNTGFYDSDSHRIWFTNAKGIVSFDPYSFNHSPVSESNFKIQSISTHDAHVTQFDDFINFTTENHDLVIKFAHVSLSNNQTRNIWFKRSDRDEWELPEHPGRIELADLPTGQTVIRFGSADGRKHYKEISILVVPAFYESTMFRILVVASVTSILVLSWIRFRRKDHPDVSIASIDSVHEVDESMIHAERKSDKVTEYILNHLSETDLDISKISKDLGMSRSSLFRTWNETHNDSITEYINAKRLEKASALLSTGQHTVTEVAHLTGFSSQSYFTKKFKSRFGFPPSRKTKIESS